MNFAKLTKVAFFATTLILATAGAKAENEAKRVFIVQSYEKGHVCGEPQAEGELASLAKAGWVVGRNLTVATYYMDTYRKQCNARERKHSPKSPNSSPISCLRTTTPRMRK